MNELLVGFHDHINNMVKGVEAPLNIVLRWLNGITRTTILRKITLALATTLSIGNATAKDSSEFIQDIVRDARFLQFRCDSYLTSVAPGDIARLDEIAGLFEKNETMRVISEQDALLSDILKAVGRSGMKGNELLDRIPTVLKGQPSYVAQYSDETYTPDMFDAAWSEFDAMRKARTNKLDKEQFNQFMYCRLAGVAAGMGPNALFGETYAYYVLDRPKKANIGYFSITADKSTYGPTVGTGNKYSEPEHWEGSRFFIVDASFKNLDTESRLPAEGSLYITYNGKEYEFDTTEAVMSKGYNIWFKSVNPLITMKTKIVYRIPEEIHGDVYWKPGRNPKGVKLFAGNIPAPK
jgi:hypothetical protein